MIHDELVATYWAFDEPVQAGEYRNRQSLESAVGRPFQSAFGKPIHSTTFDKAAALFHSLISNHPFSNGNKRTAVIAADKFLLASGYFLVLDAGEMYRLAKDTARQNERGITSEAMLEIIRDQFRSHSVRLREIAGSKEQEELREQLVRLRREVRRQLGWKSKD